MTLFEGQFAQLVRTLKGFTSERQGTQKNLEGCGREQQINKHPSLLPTTKLSSIHQTHHPVSSSKWPFLLQLLTGIGRTRISRVGVLNGLNANSSQYLLKATTRTRSFPSRKSLKWKVMSSLDNENLSALCATFGRMKVEFVIDCHRLITIYDCRVVLKWTGTASDGTEVNGSLTIPEVSHEVTLDGLSDYTVGGFPFSIVIEWFTFLTVCMVSFYCCVACSRGFVQSCEITPACCS